jgi:hypothetical protein
MTQRSRGRIGSGLSTALLVVAMGLQAAPAAGEIFVSGRTTMTGGRGECRTVIQRGAVRLRRTLSLCRKKAAPGVAACRSAKQASYLEWLQGKGCALTSESGEGLPIHTDRVFQPFNHEPGHEGNLIHPDPDDPSTTHFVSVSPAERTVVAGESATFDIAVTRQGTPHSVFVFSNHRQGDFAMTHTLEDVRIGVNDSGTHITMQTSPATVPGTYEFTIRGLVSIEHRYTEPDTFRLIVEEPEAAPPVANAGDVVTEPSNLGIFGGADFLGLSGADNEVGALFDNENNDVVDVEAGANGVPYPRFPSLDQFGGWTLATGRGYAGAANLVVWARLPGDRFVAAHLAVNTTTGSVSPQLLLAGDLASNGIVLSTDQFSVQVDGTLPTATVPGVIRGVVDGVPFFLEPNLSGNLWADRVTFEFDVPLFND